jgi:prepilin-type N-terminal cleavage/methylation domain-containing protein
MKPRSPRPCSAFTLVELLIVIGIIGVLISILLPVISKVRDQGYKASSEAQIRALSAAVDAYYGDFNAYPGPLSYSEVSNKQGTGGTVPTVDPKWDVAAPMTQPEWDKVTGTENLVLGLLGGLRRDVGATPNVIKYNRDWVGKGPGALGTSPKRFNPYGDFSDLSQGSFTDGDDVPALDSIIPEFVDRFPQGLPVLYLRARAGIRVGGTDAQNPIATNGTRLGQYDTTQVYGYVTAGTKGPIGVGKNLDQSAYVGVTFPQHGLQTAVYGSTADPMGAGGYTYPLNLFAALRHPQMADTPKQKDRYVMISPGPDRVYGTRDDCTNFGAY